MIGSKRALSQRRMRGMTRAEFTKLFIERARISPRFYAVLLRYLREENY